MAAAELLLGGIAAVATAAFDGLLGGITDGMTGGIGSVVEDWITKRFNPTEEESEIQAQIQSNERMQEQMLAFRQVEVELQERQRLNNLAFEAQEYQKNRQLQSDLASLDRELRRELAQWEQEFQANENMLNHQLQRELSALSHEFQANQGKLNRQHAERLERFRAEMQRLLLEKERELQLELKRLEGDLARELCEIERKNALALLREEKRLGHLPIGLLSEQLLTRSFSHPLPLQLFFSPPNPHFAQSANPVHVVKKFPHLEEALAESSITRGIRPFLRKYSAHGRAIEPMFGAWINKSAQGLKHEAAVRAVFSELKSNPILILESELIKYNFDLHFTFWGGNSAKPRLTSTAAFSWRDVLYDFAKLRTREWKKEAVGKSQEELSYLYGEESVKKYRENLNIMGRERRAIAMGINPKRIPRNYHIEQEDYDNLTQFITACHCLIAGLLADEYFLLHVPQDVRQYPLLPTLLPDLLKKVPAEWHQQLITIMGKFYQALSNALSQKESLESTWIPELKLKMAHSLGKLPDKSYAKQQIMDSIRAWMALRGMEPVENHQEEKISLDLLIEAMAPGLITTSDHEYLTKLDECLWAVYA